MIIVALINNQQEFGLWSLPKLLTVYPVGRHRHRHPLSLSLSLSQVNGVRDGWRGITPKAQVFVAVNVGAGYHAPSNEKALRSAMKRACLAAASILRKGPGRCVDAVAAAIQVLEVKPHFSFSFSSNNMLAVG